MTSKFGSKKKIIASTNNVTELPLAVYAHRICAPQDNNFSTFCRFSGCCGRCVDQEIYKRKSLNNFYKKDDTLIKIYPFRLTLMHLV